MRLLIALIFPFLTIFHGQVIPGYQFGGEQKIKAKKVREKLTFDDFRYPMLYNNDIYDFVTVAIYGTADPGSGVIIILSPVFIVKPIIHLLICINSIR